MFTNSDNTQYSLHILNDDAQGRLTGLINLSIKQSSLPLPFLGKCKLVKKNQQKNLRRR